MTNFFNIFSVLIAAVVAYLYFLGLEYSLFWFYWWYDIPMHLLGGLVVGFWGSALAARRAVLPYQALTLVLLAALVIGITWEIFEHVSGLTQGKPGYWEDTFKDLLNDCVGAGLAVLLYWRLYHPTSTNG
jgi:hypothetical protein